MKRMFLLLVSALLISSVAMADHIGIYPDATRSSCVLAAGFTTTNTVIHGFTIGSTGSRWSIDTSGLSGTVFAFSSSYTTVGSFTNDLSVGYGQCLTGTIVLGTLLMNATSGTLSVKPAQGFLNIIYTDCSFAEHPAFGGSACVACSPYPCTPAASEPSTWGRVKSLYR